MALSGGRFTFPGTSLSVSRIGFGAMQLPGPHVWGPPKDHTEAIAVLREVVRLGINHIDTSDYYGPYVANELIREALHPYPKDLVIVTKVGGRRGEDKSWLPAFSPAELESAVYDNCKRLGVDALDVVNLRLGIPGVGNPPLEESLGVLIALKKKGVVKHIGLSSVGKDVYDAARRMTDIVCIQNMYNVANRGDDAFIDALAKDGVAYVPFFPLGGFMTLQSEALDRVAANLGATTRQIALAWLLQRAPNILLIPGTSSLAHLRENASAADIRLPPDAVATLNAIAGAV